MNAKTEILDRIRAAGVERDRLLVGLDRSLQIEALCPDAFEHGAVKSCVVGNPWSPESLRWILTRGDGSQREFPLLDVPECLWGDFSREAARKATRGRVRAWVNAA